MLWELALADFKRPYENELKKDDVEEIKQFLEQSRTIRKKYDNVYEIDEQKKPIEPKDKCLSTF